MSDEVFGLDEINNKRTELDPNFFSEAEKDMFKCEVAQNLLNSWCRGDGPCPHLKKRDEQLIKAKNLLENFIRKGIGNVTPSWRELIAETKRFLKDCEVKQ